jgi:hypothetical protein
MMTMTRTKESTAVATPIAPTVLLAFELGEHEWKLGFTLGLGARPRVRQIPARATNPRRSASGRSLSTSAGGQFECDLRAGAVARRRLHGSGDLNVSLR